MSLEPFSELVGKTLSHVEQPYDDVMIFITSEGDKYKLSHTQECCENVIVEDIVGDLADLIGSPITMAEESTNNDNSHNSDDESFTWTFYRLATVKGYVTIRWYGSSNGPYSEAVDFEKCED